jgi:hypothetical protein
MTLAMSLTIVLGVMEATAGAAYAGTGVRANNKDINNDSGTKRAKSLFMVLPISYT